MQWALGEIWFEASKDHFQFRHLGRVFILHYLLVLRISLLSILSVQVHVRVHAYERLTFHPCKLCENKALRELENCFSLFTLHSKHLLHVKCLSLEHHL